MKSSNHGNLTEEANPYGKNQGDGHVVDAVVNHREDVFHSGRSLWVIIVRFLTFIYDLRILSERIKSTTINHKR